MSATISHKPVGNIVSFEQARKAFEAHNTAAHNVRPEAKVLNSDDKRLANEALSRKAPTQMNPKELLAALAPKMNANDKVRAQFITDVSESISKAQPQVRQEIEGRYTKMLQAENKDLHMTSLLAYLQKETPDLYSKITKLAQAKAPQAEKQVALAA